MAGTAKETATQIYNLYCGNTNEALSEVFNMAKAFEGKRDDMPNSYWRDVFIELQQLTSTTPYYYDNANR
jgi:hypothetical protein